MMIIFATSYYLAFYNYSDSYINNLFLMPRIKQKILVALSIFSMLEDLPGLNFSSADSRIL